MFENNDFSYAYCVFCRSGAEARLRDELERRFTDLKVLAPVQEKHRYINRRYEIDRRTFLSGYLFVYAKERLDLRAMHRPAGLYRFLRDEEGITELFGSDRSFAEWLWMNDGIVGISRISFEADELRIHSGPMQHFARDIVRLDKHTKNALVRMRFLNKESNMWLAFEFED